MKNVLSMAFVGICYFIFFLFLISAMLFAFVVIIIAGAFVTIGYLLKRIAELTFYWVKETNDKLEIKLLKMCDRIESK